MDNHTFNLLRGAVAGQIGQLTEVLDRTATGQRGSTFAIFVRRHLHAIEERASSIETAFAGASTPVKPALGIALARCRLLLTQLHSELVTYCFDIGRQDLPAGLLYLVDLLIDDLLKASADPLIHLNDRYMYSTQRILHRWENLSTHLGITWKEPAEPVIFNLPGLDPGNAFLAPVIAHEVGHSVIQRHDLVLELLGRLDASEIQILKETYRSADDDADVKVAQEQFQFWAEELMCDALATELTGPSFMFSVAVFFPASSAGASGPRHPDPSQRFCQTLEQLASAGWEEPLQAACPGVFAWLKTLPTVPPIVPSTPRETFLRGLVDVARPHIIQVARDYVTARMTAETFTPVGERIRALLAAGVPPGELDSKPVPPWQIIVAAWFYALEVHGDTPEGLVAAVEDGGLSRFTLKSVEMSRVMDLWGTHAS